MDSVFSILNSVNVNGHTEKKNGLTYLSWAWAWAEVKKRFPSANYTIYEDKDGNFYHTDGLTCWVKTGVTIDGIEHIEYLPVMDFKNRSIPVGQITSFDVNKAIQRSLTKAVARHGLGLYIYAGEDLPEDEARDEEVETPPKRMAEKPKRTETKKEETVPTQAADAPAVPVMVMALADKCNEFGIDIEWLAKKYGFANSSLMTANRIGNALHNWDNIVNIYRKEHTA